MTIPETIYAWRYDDKTNQGQWTKALNPNVEASFIRADIAAARVAAAYEAAAKRNELTVRSIKEALDMRDWDAAREIAMKGPPAIRALTPDDAKAALEAVRREARAEALREAAEIAYAYIGPEMGSLFYQGINSGCRAIKSRISALIDKPTQEKSDA